MEIRTSPTRRHQPLIHLVEDPVLVGRVRDHAMRQCGLLSIDQLTAGGITRAVAARRVRAGRWGRPTRGVYEVGAYRPIDLPPHLRNLRSAHLGPLTFGSRAIAVSYSALTLYDVWGVPVGSPPQIALPGASNRLNRNGIECRQFSAGSEILTIDGVRVVSAVRALAQAIVQVPARTALGLLDSALQRGVIHPEQVADVRLLVAHRRGAAGTARIWDLIDARRESPIESWAYFDLVGGGLIPTDIQVTVRDGAGRVVGRADIGYRMDDGTWLFVELDGVDYHPLERVFRDTRRDNGLLLAAGARTLRYGAADLGPAGRMVREVAMALGRA